MMQDLQLKMSSHEPTVGTQLKSVYVFWLQHDSLDETLLTHANRT